MENSDPKNAEEEEKPSVLEGIAGAFAGLGMLLIPVIANLIIY